MSRGLFRRSKRIGLVAAVCLGGAVSVASSCSSVTEVVVVIDGDVRDVDAVTVEVEGANNVVVTRKTVTLGGRSTLPLTLGVQAGATENGSFLVRAEATREGKVAVSRIVRSRLVPGESRVLVVSLCQACSGVACAHTESCNASGSCEEIPPELELPRWTGTRPRHGCGTSSGDDDSGIADAGPEAAVLEGGYHELTDSRLWSTFDLAERLDPSLRGYVGATFDHKNVYFAPYGSSAARHGRVVSYDTANAFDEPGSWSWFDLATLNDNARGYAGAATFMRDGKVPEYVYLVPFEGKSGTGDVVARLKVGGALKDPNAWNLIPLAAHQPTLGAGELGGAVVNYSHVWLPSRDPTRPFVLHENRDAQNPQRLLDAGWEAFDVRGQLDGGAGGYYGGAFNLDKKLFFAPYMNESGPHGVALMKEIGSGTANGWTTFDLTKKNSTYAGFAGAVLADGYVYYVPHQNGSGRHGNVVRYDTRLGFTDAAAWSGVDLTTFHPALQGFVGGVFDGRFVYFVPFFSSEAGIVVARYDTTMPAFTDEAAWTWFDIKKASPGAGRFNGAAFDGKYIYFVPYDNGVVVRFDARETRELGASKANGSFL